MGRRYSDGEAVRVTVPEETVIVKGNFYKLGGFIGMAMQSVTTVADETSPLILEVKHAEYETSQITVADAFAVGNDVYFVPATGLFTAVAEGAAAPADTERFGGVTRAKDGNNVVHIKRTHLD